MYTYILLMGIITRITTAHSIRIIPYANQTIAKVYIKYDWTFDVEK